MKMDRKAVGGFMEAMAAMMVVCIALTAFMGLLSYSKIDETGKDIDFENSIVDYTEFDGSVITFDDKGIQNDLYRYDLKCIKVEIKAVGPYHFSNTYGEKATDDRFSVDDGSFTLRCPDGTSVCASYEVVYWY